MTKRTSRSVVEQIYCTRCGCCVSACPQGCIYIDKYPVRGEGCIECGLCEKVCPGTGIDLKETAELLFEGEYHEYAGRFVKAYTGYSTDDSIREKATSGGVVTSLLVYLLEKGFVDGALVVSFDDDSWKTKYVVATSRDEIIESAQTKYQVTPLDIRLKDLEPERIAIVGLPCVVEGMRKMQEHSAQGGKVVILIGLFCWVNMEKEATEFLLKKLNCDVSDVQSVEYRSGDYLGGFKVQLKNGDIEFLGKECYNILPLLFAPERCLYCCDFTNELADISVGDAKSVHSKKGCTFIITRSEKGERILKGCEEAGYICTEHCEIEDILESESSAVFFKKGAYKRIQKKGIQISYGDGGIRIPLKNRFFEFIFFVVHKNREFFQTLFSILPLLFFRIPSRLITKGRS